MRHIDLCTEHVFALVEFAVFHPLEKFEVLFDRAVPPRALLAGSRCGSAVAAHFVESLLADKGLSLLDELDCPFVELIEV